MSAKKSALLGMNFGTASNRLRKLIMFDMMGRLDEDTCFRCGTKISTPDELSIEHKLPWQKNVELFWDLTNIAFSHLRCNVVAGERLHGPGPSQVHGFSMYTNHGCRCDTCREANTLHQRNRRTPDMTI